MSAKLKPFSLMGLPSKISSSEKDLHANNHTQNKQETPLLVSEAGKSVAPAISLKIRVPPCRGAGGEDDDGGCTTPKAAERGEGGLPKCPPPPRKPKSVPSKKRKAQRVLLDFSNEIESLFPSSIFMGGKIKKVRTGCPQIL